MPMSNDIIVSSWNVPPIDHNTPRGESDTGYQTSRQSVTAPKPSRPVTPAVSQRPPSIEAFTWVSTHGGAGATSLRHGSSRGLDLTTQWPDPSLGWPSAVVLVCRSNAAGLDSMGRMLQEWVSRSVRDVQVLATVVVADAPTKPSKRIRARINELRSIAPAVWTVPWVEQWRDQPYVPHPVAAQIADAIRSGQAHNL